MNIGNYIKQPEYLNPEHPLYYKGYWYQQNFCYLENTIYYRWYDEKRVCRKSIHYHNNGKKNHEAYFNENGKIHNEDGPAAIKYNMKGEIEEQYYYLNGEHFSEPDWEEKTNPKYYKGFRYEEDDYGIEMWFDENDVMRKRIAYFDNDKKWTEYYYNEKGQLHNEDGYAEQCWFNNGKINYQFYFLNGDEISEETFNYIQNLKQQIKKTII